jgi:2',3'-cyclic-nucleotide 2'-phosphodiesterase/3'-nucleotidase
VIPAGVTAVYVTGPGAAAYQPAGIRVERIGDAADGFVKYRVVG